MRPGEAARQSTALVPKEEVETVPAFLVRTAVHWLKDSKELGAKVRSAADMHSRITIMAHGRRLKSSALPSLRTKPF
jgi:hypothetical protein